MATVIDLPARDGVVLSPNGVVADRPKRRSRPAKRNEPISSKEHLTQVIQEALMKALPRIMDQVLGETAQEATSAKLARKPVLRLVDPQAGRE